MLGRGSTLHCLLMVRLDLESLGQLLVMVQTRVCNYEDLSSLDQTLGVIFLGEVNEHQRFKGEFGHVHRETFTT